MPVILVDTNPNNQWSAIMNRLSFVVVFFAFLAWIPVSQAQENPPQSGPAVTPVASSEESLPISIEGKVLVTYDNSEFILQKGEQYFVVQMGKAFWPLGIARGDMIEMKGVMKPQSLLKNEVVANHISILKKIRIEDPPLGLRTLEEVVERAGDNDLVAVRGKVSAVKKNVLRLSGDRGRIFISFGPHRPQPGIS